MKKLFKKFKTWLEPAPEKPITVIVPSYNNSQWCKKNLESIFSQNYENYQVIYIDDCSTDNTAEVAKKIFTDSGKFEKVKLIENKKRVGATANRYAGSMMAEDDSIVLVVDGDDWLAHSQVFKKINLIYSTTNTWLTYGQFKRFPSGELGHCKKLNRNFRQMDQWYASHLRTYYAWLFKLIKKEDLMYQSDFYQISGDVAEMLPMLEMAQEQTYFIDSVLYIYNQQTSENDVKRFPLEQVKTFEQIKAKKPYIPISQKPL